MLATVFRDRDSLPVVVTDSEDALAALGAGVSGVEPLLPVPINAVGNAADMHMVCDLDDDYCTVHAHAGSYGELPVTVYSTDPNVIFIRIGSIVIAVHQSPSAQEGGEAYRKAVDEK